MVSLQPTSPGATAAAATHVSVTGPREGHLQVVEAGSPERVEPVGHLLGAERVWAAASYVDPTHTEASPEPCPLPGQLAQWMNIIP